MWALSYTEYIVYRIVAADADACFIERMGCCCTFISIIYNRLNCSFFCCKINVFREMQKNEQFAK